MALTPGDMPAPARSIHDWPPVPDYALGVPKLKLYLWRYISATSLLQEVCFALAYDVEEARRLIRASVLLGERTHTSRSNLQLVLLNDPEVIDTPFGYVNPHRAGGLQ